MQNTFKEVRATPLEPLRQSVLRSSPPRSQPDPTREWAVAVWYTEAEGR